MIISGQLVSSEGVQAGQVRFEGGTIAAVGVALGRADFEYGDDCLIFAGMGDIHIHARDDAAQPASGAVHPYHLAESSDLTTDVIACVEARARQIEEQAILDGEKTKREAGEYVLQTLSSLETELDRVLSQVRNGIRTLQSEKQNTSQVENK